MEQEQTSIDKAIDVLFHLHAAQEACGLTSIGSALGLPKSSTHRLLATLARRGLVDRDEAGRYRPGISLVALGLGALDREPIVAAARPVLEREARALDETLFLTAARGGRILVLDKVEGTSVLRVSPQIGSEVPVHATAVGKLYLAFSADEVAAPERNPERFTRATRTTRAALQAEVEKARVRGWAENREEWQPGMTVVAAPVLLGDRMAGAVTLAAPAVRMSPAQSSKIGPRLRLAADGIARRMQGDPQ